VYPSKTGNTLRPIDPLDVAEAFTRCNPEQFVRPEADLDAGESASIDSKE